MVSELTKNNRNLIFRADDTLMGSSRWLITTGIAMLILGVFALIAFVATTLLSVIFIGSLFIFAAIFQTVFAVTSGRWAGLGLHLFLAVLYGVTGAFLIIDPQMGAATLTLLLAFFFITSGLIRVVASAAMRFTGWGWAFISGFIAMALGVFVILNLPEASLILLGTLLAIDLIFFGVNLTSLGVALRKSERVSIVIK